MNYVKIAAWSLALVFVAILLGKWVFGGTPLISFTPPAEQRIIVKHENEPPSSGGPLGKADPASMAPPRAPGLKGMTPAERQQLHDLALKRAPEVLPPPAGGQVGTMTLTGRVGTAPAGCHTPAGTRHDKLAGGTFQIWKRC